MIKKFRLNSARAITKSSAVPTIKGLTLWLDATSEEAFVDGQDSNGGLVSAWIDINPTNTNKIKFIQADSAKQPTYQSGGLNLLPALKFNNTNSVLYSENSIALSSLFSNNSATIFLVQDAAPAVSGSSSFFITNTSTIDVALDSANIKFNFGDSYITPNTKGGGPKIITLIKQSNAIFIRVNGETLVNGVSSGTINTINSDTINIGKQIGTHLGEIITYDHDLKDEEIKAVEAYLYKKWASKISSSATNLSTSNSSSGGTIQTACTSYGSSSGGASDGFISGGCISYGGTWGQIYTSINGTQYFLVDSSGQATAFNDYNPKSLFIKNAQATGSFAHLSGNVSSFFSGPSYKPKSCRSTDGSKYYVLSEKFYDTNGVEQIVLCDSATGKLYLSSVGDLDSYLTVTDYIIGNSQNGGQTNQAFYDGAWYTLREINGVKYIQITNHSPLADGLYQIDPTTASTSGSSTPTTSTYSPQNGDIDTENQKVYNSTTGEWEDIVGDNCTVNATGVASNATVIPGVNTYTCDASGYHGTINLSATCTNGEALTNATSSNCIADSSITCTIDNSTNGTGINSGTTVQYNTTSTSCNQGGYSGTVSFLPCTSNGQSLNITTNNCTATTCPITTTTGIAANTTVAYNAATVACNAPGYSGTVNLNSTCTSGQTLSITQACSATTCNVTQNTGITSGRTVAYNATTIDCDASGYHGTATLSGTCSTSQTLTIPASGAGSCTADSAVTCNVTGTGIQSSTTTPYNSTTIACNASGYHGTATLDQTCTSNGQNLTATGCIQDSAVTCNVTQNTGITASRTVAYNATTIDCDASGYHGTATLSAACTTSQTLTIPTSGAGSCTADSAVTCNVTGTGIAASATVAYNATTATCNAVGYTGTGTLNQTCQTNGQNLTATGCSIVTCSTPSTPSNGSLSISNGHSPAQYNDTVTLSCNSGYTVSGNSTATCQSSGSWSQSLGTCVSDTPTGGTITYICDGVAQGSACSGATTQYKVHKFTSSGSITVPSTVTSIEYLVVAGGGAGGLEQNCSNGCSSGGGAGGLLHNIGSPATWSANTYTVTVGAGGTASSLTFGPGSVQTGQNGNTSSIVGGAVNISATGGGAGGGWGSNCGGSNPGNGGSGGGATGGSAGSGVGGQGNSGSSTICGGGGGFSGAGNSYNGGLGLYSNITGSYVCYGAGGGGIAASIGNGGGCTVSGSPSYNLCGGTYSGGVAGPGTANTGCGGSGIATSNVNNGAGGSGVVIIRYQY